MRFPVISAGHFRAVQCGHERQEERTQKDKLEEQEGVVARHGSELGGGRRGCRCRAARALASHRAGFGREGRRAPVPEDGRAGDPSAHRRPRPTPASEARLPLTEVRRALSGPRFHAPHWAIGERPVLGIPAEWAAAPSDVDRRGAAASPAPPAEPSSVNRWRLLGSGVAFPRECAAMSGLRDRERIHQARSADAARPSPRGRSRPECVAHRLPRQRYPAVECRRARDSFWPGLRDERSLVRADERGFH